MANTSTFQSVEPRASSTYLKASGYFKRLIAAELSATIRYFDRAAVMEPPWREANRELFDALESPSKTRVREPEELSSLTAREGERTAVVLDGNLNHTFDIEGDLRRLHDVLGRHDRVFAVIYNAYLSPIYRVLHSLGLRRDPVPTTFLSVGSLTSVVELAGFRVVRTRCACLFPFRLFGLGDFLNRWIAAIPLVRRTMLSYIVTLQPKCPPLVEKPSLAVVVPARNEKGNIEPLFGRLGNLNCDIELIFVEGHSNDGTWEEILRCQKIYGDRFRIQAHKQTGKGKVDAVRVGFQHAKSDLLTILDADLTMPPELLNRFYDAYCRGDGDFVNGNRLLYPMEGDAMRFLNWLGNLFFARSMSFVLDSYLGDTLCGTKLMSRHDYARAVRWRNDFGDFDPFGDFEILFPAAILGLGIVDVPIRYRARTYGSTNIARFRHGLMLLRMVMVGLLRVKSGR
jgi:hypothetical protein